MDDLIAFLRARLDEDQAAAEAALKRTTTTRRMVRGEWVEDSIQPPEWRRSAWPPVRVLAEVDAKRQIIEQHERYAAERRRMMGGWDPRSDDSPILAALATVYADHPDYRDTWRP